MSCYVLDTSALLAYIENEPGTAEIDRLLRETLDDQHTLYISVISGIEVRKQRMVLKNGKHIPLACRHLRKCAGSEPYVSSVRCEVASQEFQ